MAKRRRPLRRGKDESKKTEANVGTDTALAYNAGQWAAANGGTLEDNPYTADSDQHMDFAKGYNDYCGSE